MKIDNIRIDAFRGLHDVDLQGVGGINLIVGGNNSGKTSILEAIGIFANPVDLIAWAAVARAREIRVVPTSMSGGLSSVEAIRWMFPQSVAQFDLARNPAEIFISGDGEWPMRHLTAACSEIVGIPPEPRDRPRSSRKSEADAPLEEKGWHISVRADMDPFLSGDLLDFGGRPDEYRVETDLWPSEGFRRSVSQRGKHLRSVTLAPYSHRNEPVQLRSISRSILSRDKGTVVDLLKTIDQNIEDIEIVTSEPYGTPALLVVHREAGLVPISVLGDGFRRALSIALALYQARGGLLLIDEFETAFHVSALDKIFPWIVETAIQLDVQVFATTHSLEAIHAITAGLPDSSRNILTAYHVSPEESRAPVKRYNTEMLRRLVLSRGLDIR